MNFSFFGSKAAKETQSTQFAGYENYMQAVFKNLITNGLIQSFNINGDVDPAKTYETSPTVFSIINRILAQESQVEWCVYQKDDGVMVEIEDENHPVVMMLNNANPDQTFTEVKTQLYLNYLTNGNGVLYFPTFKKGNDAGKLMGNIGIYCLPSQHVAIESGGYLEPIKNYLIDYNIVKDGSLPKSDIIHIRYPSMDILTNKGLWGVSPIKVAANIIKTEKNGDSQQANLLGRGMPPGILNRIFPNDEMNGKEAPENVIKNFLNNWRKKAKDKEPIYGFGKHEWIKLGYDTIKDMNLIETSNDGVRRLCNIWLIPSVLLDMSGSTFANQKEARQAIYTNQIIPFQYMFAEKLNAKLKQAYPGVEVWPEYTDIPELYEGRSSQITDALAGFREGILTGDDVLVQGYGLKPTGLPEMQVRYMSFGKVPMSQVMEPIEQDPDEALQKAGVEHYLKGIKK